MQHGVRGMVPVRVLFPFAVALLGVAAGTLASCAAGSDAATESSVTGGTDSGSNSGDATGSSRDSGSESGDGTDASQSDDARRADDSSSGGDSAPGIDSAPGADSGTGVDAGADAGSDADSGSADAAPAVVFGPSCPAGTVYAEPFTSDPIADGTFLPLTGSSTYDPVQHTVSLAAGSANTQLWLGPRPTWASYTVSASVRIDAASANGNGGFTFRMESSPSSPANNAGQMYYAGIATNQVILGLENGNWTEFSGPSATFTMGTFHTLDVTANGTSLSVSVDGTSYITYTDSTYTFGSFGLRTYALGMTYGAITVTCH
jgi:hypothetical protein